MHETVFKNCFGDVRRAFRTRHQRHELRLQIGRKAGERRGRNLDRPDAGAVARDTNAFVVRRDGRACFGQHVQRRLQQFGTRAGELHIAAGHRDRHGIGAGLDAIRQNGMPRAVQLGHAFDDNARRAGAGNLRAHLVEAVGDIDDLRLARRVGDDRRALGERRRHQRHMGAADRDFRKIDLRAG